MKSHIHVNASVLCLLAIMSDPLPVQADDATLHVSIAGGSFNSKFKFWDASEGCPSYNDIPSAKHFLGGVMASNKGAGKKLAAGQPVHVFMFRPKDTPGISAAGGQTEIRRRALQVVLGGDARLRYTGFEENVPTWEASGEISVVPATDCETRGEDEKAIDAAGISDDA